MSGRTSLTRYAPAMRDPDPDGARKLAARQWYDTGNVILFAADIAKMDMLDRELVNALAAKLYGKRQA